MKNIFNYLEEYSQVSFKEDALNQVDMLIFAQLSYIYFEDVIGNTDFISLNSLTDKISQMTLKCYDAKKNKRLFLSLASSKRYQNLKIGYIKTLLNQDTQYFSMTLEIEGYLILVYRGTDTMVSGWKENLNMSVLSHTPSQKLALDYAKEMIHILNKPLYLIGHSKGGNIASYAAIKLDKKSQDKIIKVYDFDGPGFSDDLFSFDEYLNISEKVIRLVPYNDIVGVLLNFNKNYKIVSSYGLGVFQHDLYMWKIEGNDFLYENKLSYSSKLFSKSVLLWLNEMSYDKKLLVLDTIFKFLNDSNISDFNDFIKSPFKSIGNIIKGYSFLTKDDKKLMRRLIMDLFLNLKDVFFKIEDK